MDKPIEHYWQLRIANLKTALEKNNFEVHLAPRSEDACRIVTEEILPAVNPASMSWGGSRTFVECGLYRQLREMAAIEVIDTYDTTLSDDAKMEQRRRASGQSGHDRQSHRGPDLRPPVRDGAGGPQQNRTRSGECLGSHQKLRRAGEHHAAEKENALPGHFLLPGLQQPGANLQHLVHNGEIVSQATRQNHFNQRGPGILAYPRSVPVRS